MLPSLAAIAQSIVARSGGNPNHGADGKFSSGGGGKTYTPAERWDMVNEAIPVGVTIYEDGITHRILNGPWKGRKLPFIPTKEELAGRNISDSLASEKTWMRYGGQIQMRTMMKKYGVSRAVARAHARAFIRNRLAAIDPPVQMQGAMQDTPPPRPPDTARVALQSVLQAAYRIQMTQNHEH